MTTTLDTSCSENTMVLSARRGFLHACIFLYRISPVNDLAEPKFQIKVPTRNLGGDI